MSNRSFIQTQALIKGQVELHCAVLVGAAGAITLREWNYPQMGQGTTAPARTYTAAPTTGGSTSFPSRYAQGAEGVYSVARTAAGLWTVTLQDRYQRMVRLTGYASLAGGLSAIDSVAENTTITDMGAAGGSVIGVALLLNSVATDPAADERINLSFTLQYLTAL